MKARSRLVPPAAFVALIFVSTTCGDGPTTPAAPERTPSLYVGNTEPTASAGGPYSGTEGVAITFDASASSDPEADYPLTYAWDFESDGVVDTTTTAATVEHAYPDEGTGTYTATLTVTDSASLSSVAAATAEVTVANDAPAPTLPAELSTTAGEIFALNGTLADKGAEDGPWSVIYDWGDGTADTSYVTSVSAGITGAHAYARGGSYTVQATVTDADGATGSATSTVTATSLPLVASAGGPYSATEGAPVAFDGSASSDPDGDALTYAWDFGDGATGTGATPAHTYADDGTYTVTLTVSDAGGATGTATTTANVANAPPTVDAGADAAVNEGATFTLAGTFGDAGAGDGAWSYSIDWGDGSAAATGSVASPGAVGGSHAYAAPGTYTATLTVTDKDGAGVSDALVVTVAASRPVASAGGPYTGTEGATVSFDGSASTDPNGDALTYSWSWGDGSPAGSGATPTHAYADNGTYTVTLTVGDGALTATASTTVTVANAPPLVNAGADATINDGQALTLAATFSDAGATDGPWTYAVSWGDASANASGSLASQGGVGGSHTYAAPGTYTVTVTVTDKDGAGVSDALVATVVAIKPTASAGGPYTGTEGSAVAFDGGGSTDPNGDALTYSWNFGDGATGTGATPTHAYVDNGTYTVTLTVRDPGGSTSTATTTATITNAPPLVSAGPDAAINEGATFTLAGTFSDAGTADAPWSYAVNWGDGSPNGSGSLGSQGAVSASHAYAVPGSYTVTLTVTDKNGAGVSDALVLTVAAVKPTARAGGPYAGVEGAAIAFDGSTSTDPNGDALTYSWNWGDGTAAGTGATPTHAYRDNGTYTVTLTVRDPANNTSTATTAVTVTNAAPVVNAGPDKSANEAQPPASISISATFTDAGVADNAWSYTIAWGDGTTRTGTVSTQTAITASKAYAAPGTYTVTVTVRDKDNGSGSDAAVFTVNALWPTANAGGPYTGGEGTPIAFTGGGSTDPNGDALTYAWDFNADNVTDATTATPSYTYPDGGSYTARLIVADPAGHRDTATAAVTVTNIVGTVNAGPDGTVSLGSAFQLAGSFNDSPGDGPWTYQVAWGDGSTTFGNLAAPGAITPAHGYAAAGSYTATLTVTGSDGGSGTDAAVVTVGAFQNPVANANGPYTANEGAFVQFTTAGTTAPGGQTLSYSWSFGDGTSSPLSTPLKSYADNGTYTVVLTVKTSAGGTSSDTTTATIANAAPTGNFTAPYSLVEGTDYGLALTGYDAGTIDRTTLEFSFDCGQGAGFTGWSTTAKSVACPGVPDQRSVTVSGQLRDKDGAVTPFTRTLNATNALPVVAFAATSETASVASGTAVSFEGSFTDKGVNDAPWTYTVAWGDGTPSATGTATPGAPIAVSHPYTKPGTWYAMLSVKDKDGATGSSARIAVSVANGGPTAAANGPYAGNEGAYVAFSSAGTSDPEGQYLSYSWSFGDGTTSAAPNPSKAYADDGSYTVTLIVKDASGAADTSATTATIANVAPTGSLTAPFSVAEGTDYTLTVNGTDVSATDRATLEYSFDCGQGAGATAWSTAKSVVCPGVPDQRSLAVSGQVRDKDGGVNAYSKTFNATNAAPVATFAATSPTGPLVSGTMVSFEGSFTDKGETDAPWTYTVVWGDGTPSTTGTAAPGAPIAVSHVYTKPGNSSAYISVKDKDGATGMSPSVVVNVGNDAPVASANGPYAGNEGANIAFSSAGSSDPNGQTLTYLWTFGDGTTSSFANPSKAYADDGSYTVTLVVKDASGATDTSVTTATVANVAPTATFSVPFSLAEGTAYAISLLGTDAATADRATLQYALDCGLGAGFTAWSTTAKSLICAGTPDQRSLTIQGKVRDKDGGETLYTRVVNVTNALPVVTASATSPTTFAVGGTLDLQGSFTDKGTGDGPWSYTITWGDLTATTTGTGTPGTAIVGSHTYAKAGTFYATLSVKDKDNGTGTSTRITVTVTP